MVEKSEVVIVGGGVAGCATAYYLARAGVRATIIEREGVGTQASGYSAGGLNPLQGAGIPGPLAPLAIESFRMHRRLWEELQSEARVDYQGRIVSLVKVAFEESDLPELQETLEIFYAAQADGFSARWLERAEVLDLEPRIAPNIIRGLYACGNAALDSYLYNIALVKGAEKYGASVRPGTVRGLNRSGERVTGVLLEDGQIACGQVVLAMGPWSQEAQAWLEVPVPVEPLKGEILRMELPGPPPAHDFSCTDGSLHPKPDGRIWCGTTEERRGFDKKTSASARQSIWKGAIKLIPTMAEARLVQQTACLRPVTPDWLPILGRAPGWDNVYLATGAGKKGILLSPGMGRAIADLITQGSTNITIGPYMPERFIKV
jgi:glycine/D-amino acid oxidase-like deaminating enzyme